MLTTSIKILQTLADFAALNAGNTSALFAIAFENSKSITDDVAAGTQLNYDLIAALPKNYYSPQANVASTFKQALKRFQTPVDYATQFPGDASAVIEVCKQNNISITDDVAPGTILIYQQKDKKTATYFLKKGFDVTTGDSIVIIQRPEGIGYWYIESPEPIFTVS